MNAPSTTRKQLDGAAPKCVCKQSDSERRVMGIIARRLAVAREIDPSADVREVVAGLLSRYARKVKP